MANPFAFFLRCLILSVFGYKRERLVIFDLFNKFSYRYNQNDQHSILIPVRYLKAALTLLYTPVQEPELDKTYGKFAFDGKKQILKTKQEYLDFIGEPIPCFIFRDNLYNHLNFFEKLFYAGQLLFIFILLFPVILIKKDKAKISLILLELTESLLLSKFLQKNICKELLVFQAYEKDIAFISYFLQTRLTVKISLVPSSNPISIYYQRVIGNTFIFTAPFQKIEYQKLKHNWYVEQTRVWPPFGVNTVKRNADSHQISKPLVLGLLSSASALREYLHHTNNFGNTDYQAEYTLITALKKLMDEAMLIDKLIIYLHPLEKQNPENLSFSIDYYKNIFSTKIEFAPFDIPSRECFELCSLGISGFSSSQMERLYGGYKTIFAPMNSLGNYFSDPRLDAISVQNYTELKEMIEKVKNMSDNDFFKKYELLEYRWDSYQPRENSRS